MNDVFKLSLIIALFTATFIFIELLQRYFKISKIVTRKTAHVVGAGGAATLPLFISFQQIAIVGTVFVGAMLVSKHRNIFASIHGAGRVTYGEVYMPLAVAITALLAPSALVFTYGCLVMAFADVAAEYIGKKYGKPYRNTFFKTKTKQGSFAFFTVAAAVGSAALFVTSHTTGTSLLAAFFVALVCTFVEAVSGKGSDNLTVPLAVTALLALLHIG